MPDADLTDDVLVCHALRKTYDPDTAPVRALRGVDLAVRRGEFVAVVGPSGSGKSTLLNVVAGLDRADEGQVLLAGHDLAALGEADLARLRRRHVGIVFQFFNLIDGLTVLDNVAFAARVAGSSRRAAENRAHELLDMLGLLEKVSASPPDLSGGQRQRMAIARALANDPTILLADEPTGSLDSEGGALVLDLFGRLRSRGQTILTVTHNAGVAAAADRIIELRDGQVVVDQRCRALP